MKKTTLKAAAVCAAFATMLLVSAAGAGNRFISVQEESVWNEELNRWCILRTTRTGDTTTDVYSVKEELICR